MDYFDELYLTERDFGEDLDSELHRASRCIIETGKHRFGDMNELSDEFGDGQGWDDVY